MIWGFGEKCTFAHADQHMWKKKISTISIHSNYFQHVSTQTIIFQACYDSTLYLHAFQLFQQFQIMSQHNSLNFNFGEYLYFTSKPFSYTENWKMRQLNEKKRKIKQLTVYTAVFSFQKIMYLVLFFSRIFFILENKICFADRRYCLFS